MFKQIASNVKILSAGLFEPINIDQIEGETNEIIKKRAKLDGSEGVQYFGGRKSDQDYAEKARKFLRGRS